MIFYSGATPMTTAEFRDASTRELVDPNTAEVAVYDPNGTLVVDDDAMTKDEVGMYHYYIDTSSLTVFGEYNVYVKGTRNNRTAIEKMAFVLWPLG